MPDCSFPNCSRHAQPNGYCIGHKHYAALKIERTPQTRIPTKSKVMTENHKEYKKIVIEMLLKSKRCEINAPDVCSKIAQGLHHMKKRGEFLLDKRFLKRSCNNCNSFLEANTDWGIEHGFILSKFNESEKV